MARTFCIPGIIFLFCALVLSFIVSISLPYWTAMDIARVHFGGTPSLSTSSNESISELRFGIWAYCFDETAGYWGCDDAGHGYSVTLYDSSGGSVTVASSWTRGLLIHPIATAITFIALILSLSQHITVTLIASIVSFLAAFVTLVAFIVDIALFAWAKNQMGKLSGDNASTITGPGFWLTFVAMILLFMAGCTVCLGRRRDRMSGARTSYSSMPTKGGFFSRFRRN